jgi:hypothetical protein
LFQIAKDSALTNKLPEYTEDMGKKHRQFINILSYARNNNFFGFFKEIDLFVAEGIERKRKRTGKLLLFYRDVYFKRAGVPEGYIINKGVADESLSSDWKY